MIDSVIKQQILEDLDQLPASLQRRAQELVHELVHQSVSQKLAGSMRNGGPVLSPRAGAKPVTLEIVNRLRDDEWLPHS